MVKLRKRLKSKADFISKSAKEKIEKIGGSITILKERKINQMANGETSQQPISHSHDLRNRIVFTILLLCVYRLGTYVPLGIDPFALQQMMSSSQKGLLGMFNVFSGGAVQRMAIFALGIMPYISSSIIVQLLTGVSDYFKI